MPWQGLHRRRWVPRVLAAAVALAAATAQLASAGGTGIPASQLLVSRTSPGSPGGGPSLNAVISKDTRKNSVVAFESSANFGGDTNGKKDIYIVRRRATSSESAPAWQVGSGPSRITRGYDGKPANGDSYGAAVNGSQQSKPTCVAFISRASNLVRGDTNGVADAFVYELSTRRLQRVSVGGSGRQANGDSHDVGVNGHCSKIAFTSTASNLALTGTRESRRKPYVTGRPTGSRRQVYVRMTSSRMNPAPLRNFTFLASVSGGRRAGNGDSFDVDLDIQHNKSSLVFTSTSTNLAPKDKGSTADVYERELPMSGRGHRTKLVSATSGGHPGNGPSGHPAINGDGTAIAFDTMASNLIAGDGNRVSDVLLFEDANRPHSAQGWDRGGRFRISYSAGKWGNGPSRRPELIEEGGWVVFQSDATNFTSAYEDDRDPLSDIYLWTRKRGSRHNVLLSTGAPGRGIGVDPHTSSFGNYVVYTSLPSANRAPQIWLSYVGPK